MSDDDTRDICDTVSPFAVVSLYHDMAKLLNITIPSSQLEMTNEDKGMIISMMNDVIDPELADVCEYIQNNCIEDIRNN